MLGLIFLLTELAAVRGLSASNGPVGGAPWVDAALGHLGDLENEQNESKEEKRRFLGILVANEKPTSTRAEFAIPLTVHVT